MRIYSSSKKDRLNDRFEGGGLHYLARGKLRVKKYLLLTRRIEVEVTYEFIYASANYSICLPWNILFLKGFFELCYRFHTFHRRRDVVILGCTLVKYCPLTQHEVVTVPCVIVMEYEYEQEIVRVCLRNNTIFP